MTRGRKPKPVALRLVEGNPGRRPLPKAKPKPAAIAPRSVGRPKEAVAMPYGLDAEEKKIWKRLVAASPAGVLTRADEEKLTLAVKARRLYDMADAHIAPETILKEWGRGTRVHAAIRIRREAAAEYAKLLSDLGFDPIARTRLGIRDDEETPVDGDEARFFGG